MSNPRHWTRLDTILIALLFAAALAVRTYQLQSLPPGLFSDEAANGLDAIEVLNGRYSIFFERNAGREPLFIYLQALVISIVGATPFALRLTAAIIGALTIPATYWMVREAFAATELNSRWLALWSSLLLAFSYWHISLSRIGFRAILLPLTAALAFAFFWQAWRKLQHGRPWPWVTLSLCGTLVGASLYTYTAGRFVPILVTLSIVVALLARPGTQPGTWLSLKQAGVVFGLIALVSLIVFLPLGIYFLRNPDSFFGRAASVSILNPYFAGEEPLRALRIGIVDTVKMLFVLPDPNARHNPAEQPVLDVLLAGWLAVGCAIALLRWRTLPYLVVLGWLPLMALPAVLTAEGVPHSLRAVGMMPAVFILPAIGMMAVAQWIGRRWTGRSWQMVALAIPALFVVFSSYTGVHSYFAAWRDPEKFRMAFLTDYVQLAARMSTYGEADAVWLLPLSPNYYPTEDPTFYTIDFLYEGEAGHGAVAVSENMVAEQLLWRVNSYRYAYLLHTTESAAFPEAAYIMGDPKGLLEFVLEKHAQFRSRHDEALIGLPFSVYELPQESSYTVAEEVGPIQASFQGQVTLVGADYGHTVIDLESGTDELSANWTPSGHRIWAVLRWEADQPIVTDLKVSLTLRDQDGHIAGQVDDLLVGDRYPVERIWEVGEQTGSYHILPTLPGIVPGRYQLFVKVYEDASQRIYPVVNSAGEIAGTEFLVGSIEVTRPLQTPEFTPAHSLPPTTQIGSDLRLLGYDLPRTILSPGDSLPVTVYWEAMRAPGRDYGVELELRGEDGSPVAVKLSQPAFPTSEWQPGDMLRDWHDLPISVTVPSGQYELVLGIVDSGETVYEIGFGPVEVAGRVRYFEPPSMTIQASGTFARSVQLLGVDAETGHVASPGDSLSLALIWQVLDVPRADLIRFIHLLDESGQPIAQQDTIPCEGACPTSSWVQDEILIDGATLTVPTGTAPGAYRIGVGWYDQATLQRVDGLDENGQQLADGLLVLPYRVEVQPAAD